MLKSHYKLGEDSTRTIGADAAKMLPRLSTPHFLFSRVKQILKSQHVLGLWRGIQVAPIPDGHGDGVDCDDRHANTVPEKLSLKYCFLQVARRVYCA
jgi:hypothetical protein